MTIPVRHAYRTSRYPRRSLAHGLWMSRSRTSSRQVRRPEQTLSTCGRTSRAQPTDPELDVRQRPIVIRPYLQYTAPRLHVRQLQLGGLRGASPRHIEKRCVFQELPEPNRACLVGVYAVTLDPLLSLYGIIYVTWYTRLLPKATSVTFQSLSYSRSRDPPDTYQTRPVRPPKTYLKFIRHTGSTAQYNTTQLTENFNRIFSK